MLYIHPTIISTLLNHNPSAHDLVYKKYNKKYGCIVFHDETACKSYILYHPS